MRLRELVDSASVESTVTQPEEKQLQTTSFVIHATRGVVRDPQTRRKAMFTLTGFAVLLLIAGTTLLQAPLNPREHPVGFILFWIVCGWITLTALLLAFFDLMMLRLEARKARRALQEQVKSQTPNAE